MTSCRPHARIRQYLADWVADRSLVYTDLHRAQVDHIYTTDPVVRGYTVGWDAGTHTPYAHKRGTWFFPPNTPAATCHAIQHRHACTSALTPTPCWP